MYQSGTSLWELVSTWLGHLDWAASSQLWSMAAIRNCYHEDPLAIEEGSSYGICSLLGMLPKEGANARKNFNVPLFLSFVVLWCFPVATSPGERDRKGLGDTVCRGQPPPTSEPSEPAEEGREPQISGAK